MSMIREQISELRYQADIYNTVGSACELNRAEAKKFQTMLREAANTIESLSKKLQAENMERTAVDSGEMNESILEVKTPKNCHECELCYEYRLCFVKIHNSGCCCGGRIMEEVPESGKPNWCPLKESSADCGGWIPCSTGNMPDMGSAVLIQFKSDMNGITGDDDRTFDISYMRSRDNSEWFCSTGKYPIKAVKAWKPIESYHEP